jgi:hypothetical protein
MSKEPEEPMQDTQPRTEHGAEGPAIQIPVPKRDDVLSAMRKIAKAPGSRRRSRRSD